MRDPLAVTFDFTHFFFFRISHLRPIKKNQETSEALTKCLGMGPTKS